MKIIEINGANINDISSFYDEINRVFMQNENWQLGESLDAFNDLLYGGFGELKGFEKVRLIWKDFEKNRKDLGFDETKKYYQKKLEQPEIFNSVYVQKKLSELDNDYGPTYFDILIEIIQSHSQIELICR